MFWDNFWSNFFSDLAAGIILGIGFGIFIQIMIGKWLRKEEDTERTKEVLQLLKKEILKNYDGIDNRIKTMESKAVLVFPGIRDEVWSALSRSGNLGVLGNNLLMMERLASAYDIIATIKMLERNYFRGATDSLLVDENQINILGVENLKISLVNGYKGYKVYVEKLLSVDEFADIEYDGKEETVFRVDF